ncbi:MAG: DUF1295 domain-containing protein, partial [Solirubrobacterales bacterium]
MIRRTSSSPVSPFSAAHQGGALGEAVIPGVVVFLVGFVFEAVGDEQLRRFKVRPENRSQVMDRG